MASVQVENSKVSSVSSSTTTTQLTPNSQAVNQSTAQQAVIAFQVLPGAIAYWTPSVSANFTTATLSANVGSAAVTFTKGMTVTYSPNTGGGYTIFVTGIILDGGTEYNVVGLSLGTFIGA
jgi:hypothetical protein